LSGFFLTIIKREAVPIRHISWKENHIGKPFEKLLYFMERFIEVTVKISKY